jgi:hypothetical protein
MGGMGGMERYGGKYGGRGEGWREGGKGREGGEEGMEDASTLCIHYIPLTCGHLGALQIIAHQKRPPLLWHCKSSTLSHQGLLLQHRCCSIEYKDWLYPAIQQLTDTVKEHNQVSIRQWLAMSVTHPLHCLVQPNADI